MDLTEAQDERLNVGIDQFVAGHSIGYYGVVFYTSKDVLHVNSFSDWEPERTSHAHAKAKIARSKDVLDDLSSRSVRFAAAIGNLQPVFTVCHDYGVGSSALAREIGGEVQWIAVSPNNSFKPKPLRGSA